MPDDLYNINLQFNFMLKNEVNIKIFGRTGAAKTKRGVEKVIFLVTDKHWNAIIFLLKKFRLFCNMWI